MPLSRDLVRPRLAGLVELADEAPIRFGTVEPHQVIKAALATADLYGPVLETKGLPEQAVLAVSVRRDVPLADLADRTGRPAQRRSLRERFLPDLQPLLDRLDGPRPLTEDEGYDSGLWR